MNDTVITKVDSSVLLQAMIEKKTILFYSITLLCFTREHKMLVYNTHKNTYLYLTRPQGFNEFIQFAADVVYRRLAPSSSRTFLAFT